MKTKCFRTKNKILVNYNKIKNTIKLEKKRNKKITKTKRKLDTKNEKIN